MKNIDEILEELDEYIDFTLFNEANDQTFEKTMEFFGSMPEDLQTFYKKYNGGFCFDCYFCSVDGANDSYLLSGENHPEVRESYSVPEDVIIFINTGYGDLVGYNKAKDIIVQINPEADMAEWATWASFTDYMNDFMEESKQLVEEGALEPIIITAE